MNKQGSEVALALAAGGARGAYQAGVLLLLSEKGLRFNAVAGTSIGSLNAAFYTQGDGSPGHIQQLIDLWRTVPDLGIIQLRGEAVLGALAGILARDISALTSIVGGVALGKITILDPQPVVKLLDSKIDFNRACTSKTQLIVAVLPESAPILDIITGTWKQATYMEANKIGPSNLRKALIAAGAIPFAFPSHEIEGIRYSDAGLADPLPSKYLRKQGYKHIVSVFLSEITLQNRADFEEAILFNFRPSVPIDVGIHTMLDFSQSSIEKLIDLGYKDAQNYYNDALSLFNELTSLRERGKQLQDMANTLPVRHRPSEETP